MRILMADPQGCATLTLGCLTLSALIRADRIVCNITCEFYVTCWSHHNAMLLRRTGRQIGQIGQIGRFCILSVILPTRPIRPILPRSLFVLLRITAGESGEKRSAQRGKQGGFSGKMKKYVDFF